MRSKVSLTAAVCGGGRVSGDGHTRRLCVAEVLGGGSVAAVRGGGRSGSARGFPGHGRTRWRSGGGHTRRPCAAEALGVRPAAAVRGGDLPGAESGFPGRGRTRRRSGGDGRLRRHVRRRCRATARPRPYAAKVGPARREVFPAATVRDGGQAMAVRGGNARRKCWVAFRRGRRRRRSALRGARFPWLRPYVVEAGRRPAAARYWALAQPRPYATEVRRAVPELAHGD